MRTHKFLSILFFVSLPLLAPYFTAQAEDFVQTDVQGIQDHSQYKRFEGSILVAGDKRTFDEFVIALGRVEFDYSAQAFKPWNKIKAEGARHTTYYRMPKDVTTVEALRNYENELTANGFETLWKGSKEELDNGYGRFVGEVYNHSKENTLMEYVFPAADDYRYLASHKKNEDGSEVYVSGFFVIVPPSWDNKFGHVGDGLARIDVIETKPLANRMITVKAEEVGQQLRTAGKVALYGILFDTNKAEIKPESVPTLDEIAKFLNTEASTKVLVVGHTDTVGGFESNRDLSDRRAKAVVERLSSQYHIARERLFPFGVSFAAPAATNDTEEGKAKNRRVELVKY